MSETGRHELTEAEKGEVRRMCKDMELIHQYVDDAHLLTRSKDNAERFIGLTFGHTRTLARHSITLTTLTRWLKWLTIVLVILSGVHIFLTLNEVFKWF